MLVYHSRLVGTTVYSVQSGGPIGQINSVIVDPNNLQIIAFQLTGPLVNRNSNILDVTSVREYSNYGIVIDTSDELVSPSDVIKIEQILSLNFELLSLKVETKKGSKLGQVIDFTIDSDSFLVQQIIVKRPVIKRFVDPELVISRKEIVEITDYKIIVKDEEKTLKARAEQEDFIPNFVNPFRKTKQDFAPIEPEDEN